MSIENYQKLMEKIYDNSADNALLAYWNLIVERNSEKLNYTKENIKVEKSENTKKFERISELDKKLHKKDKTFFYTDFVVEKVIKYGNS